MKNYIIVGLAFVIGLAATQLIYAQTLDRLYGPLVDCHSVEFRNVTLASALNRIQSSVDALAIYIDTTRVADADLATLVSYSTTHRNLDDVLQELVKQTSLGIVRNFKSFVVTSRQHAANVIANTDGNRNTHLARLKPVNDHLVASLEPDRVDGKQIESLAATTRWRTTGQYFCDSGCGRYGKQDQLTWNR